MAAEPLPADSDLLPLAVSDVRQHVYCPRIPYFRLGLRLPHRPVTFKMAEGIRAHERTEALEARRSLHAYGLASGERHFAVALHSPRLGLSGRLDMVIVLPTEAIPVEWKNSAGPLGLNHKYQLAAYALAAPASTAAAAPTGLNHKYQLAAYALLAEDCFGRLVRRTFVYWIPARRAEPVTITPAMRRYAKRVLADIRRAVAREQLPEGTRVLGRCRECEFLGYCNDRW